MKQVHLNDVVATGNQKKGTSPSLTYSFDDGILQCFLFSRGGFVLCGIVIVTSQLVVDALPELPQQRVEHLQYCGTYSKIPRYTLLIRAASVWTDGREAGDSPTDPDASITAASDRTSTIPARTEAGLLLLASR